MDLLYTMIQMRLTSFQTSDVFYRASLFLQMLPVWYNSSSPSVVSSSKNSRIAFLKILCLNSSLQNCWEASLDKLKPYLAFFEFESELVCLIIYQLCSLSLLSHQNHILPSCLRVLLHNMVVLYRLEVFSFAIDAYEPKSKALKDY